jgi:outer membrane protein assembly factor BamB
MLRRAKPHHLAMRLSVLSASACCAIAALLGCVANGPAPIAAAQSASASNGDWLTYQHDASRSGVADGSFSNAANANVVWESSQLDGQVYAQPLVTGGRVFVATENNTVYALDASNGNQVWSQHFGDPVPRSMLPCGNIDPTGITSTPVIDAPSGTLYAVDYLQQPQPHHELVALDINSGTVKFNQAIDPTAGGVVAHQQRAALALANGTVYVPFGGLFGDCGDYHGWVIGAAPSDGSQKAIYQVPTHREGAIWAAPALTTNGDLYVATGNGDSNDQFDMANAVVHLSPDLQQLDYYAPSDWASLSQRDADVGSTGPTLLDNNEILQVGKRGDGYLLQADHLGQIGGELFQASVCSGAYGQAAHSAGMAYMPCRDGLAAVQIQGQSFDVAWHGPRFNAGSPTITDSAIWTMDDSTATLYALNPQDGSPIWKAPTQPVSNPPHFLTPAAEGGRLYYSRGTTIVAVNAGP